MPGSLTTHRLYLHIKLIQYIYLCIYYRLVYIYSLVVTTGYITHNDTDIIVLYISYVKIEC